MSDDLGDRLQEAMSTEAARFCPAQPLGTTKGHLVDRVRRRQRRLVSTGAMALVLVVGCATAVAVGRSSVTNANHVAVDATGPAPSHSRPSVHAGGAAAPDGSQGPPVSSPGGGTPANPGSPGSTVAGRTGSHPTPTPSTSTPAGDPSPPSTVPDVTTIPTPVDTAPPFATIAPSTTAVMAVSHVRGSVLVRTACPVAAAAPTTGAPCSTASTPKPGPAHIELRRSDGSIAAQGDAGSDGKFNLSVAAGTYTVSAQPIVSGTSVGQGCTATPIQVTLTPGAAATVSVSCATAKG
jgi:hypothetical protein